MLTFKVKARGMNWSMDYEALGFSAADVERTAEAKFGDEPFGISVVLQ